MKIARYIQISFIVIFLLFIKGCISLSTYQSPKIIEKGKAQIGAGMLAGFGGNGETGFGELLLIGRYGISDRIDIGAKIYGMPVVIKYYSLYGDIRYQILTEPLYVSGALGISTFHIDNYRTTGLYPTIMFGTERIYGGMKWIQLIASSDEAKETLGTNFPGVVAGASFGRSFSFMPELNVYFAEDELLVFPGIGLQYNF